MATTQDVFSTSGHISAPVSAEGSSDGGTAATASHLPRPDPHNLGSDYDTIFKNFIELYYGVVETACAPIIPCVDLILPGDMAYTQIEDVEDFSFTLIPRYVMQLQSLRPDASVTQDIRTQLVLKPRALSKKYLESSSQETLHFQGNEVLNHETRKRREHYVQILLRLELELLDVPSNVETVELGKKAKKELGHLMGGVTLWSSDTGNFKKFMDTVICTRYQDRMPETLEFLYHKFELAPIPDSLAQILSGGGAEDDVMKPVLATPAPFPSDNGVLAPITPSPMVRGHKGGLGRSIFYGDDDSVMGDHEDADITTTATAAGAGGGKGNNIFFGSEDLTNPSQQSASPFTRRAAAAARGHRDRGQGATTATTTTTTTTTAGRRTTSKLASAAAADQWSFNWKSNPNHFSSALNHAKTVYREVPVRMKRKRNASGKLKAGAPVALAPASQKVHKRDDARGGEIHYIKPRTGSTVLGRAGSITTTTSATTGASRRGSTGGKVSGAGPKRSTVQLGDTVPRRSPRKRTRVQRYLPGGASLVPPTSEPDRILVGPSPEKRTRRQVTSHSEYKSTVIPETPVRAGVGVSMTASAAGAGKTRLAGSTGERRMLRPPPGLPYPRPMLARTSNAGPRLTAPRQYGADDDDDDDDDDTAIDATPARNKRGHRQTRTGAVGTGAQPMGPPTGRTPSRTRAGTAARANTTTTTTAATTTTTDTAAAAAMRAPGATAATAGTVTTRRHGLANAGINTTTGLARLNRARSGLSFTPSTRAQDHLSENALQIPTSDDRHPIPRSVRER